MLHPRDLPASSVIANGTAAWIKRNHPYPDVDQLVWSPGHWSDEQMQQHLNAGAEIIRIGEVTEADRLAETLRGIRDRVYRFGCSDDRDAVDDLLVQLHLHANGTLRELGRQT